MNTTEEAENQIKQIQRGLAAPYHKMGVSLLENEGLDKRPLARELAVWASVERFREDVESRDFARLKNRLHAGNPISLRAFQQATGVSLGRTNASRLRALEEYCGPEEGAKVREQERGDQEKAEAYRRKQAIWDGLAKLPGVMWQGKFYWGRAFLETLWDRGYTHVTEGKKGAVPVILLENSEKLGIIFRRKAELAWIRARKEGTI